MSKQESRVTYRVQRYNPEKDNKPYFQEFTVPTKRGMTILDGLIYIKENLDSTLSFRTSCRMGICGSCGVLVNNYPHLACHTQIEEFHSPRITVKPLPNSSVIKDLVVDLLPMFNRHKSVKPFIIRDDKEEMAQPTCEYKQMPDKWKHTNSFPIV
jgi:succinate dehydrogenase / fumarate reductase iron-sulfur subunit